MKIQTSKAKLVEKMRGLLATESHYAPYSDADLAELLGVNAGIVRYWRVNYFRVGNTLERRANYLGYGERDNANRKQDERAAAKGKGRSEAVQAGAATGKQETTGDN